MYFFHVLFAAALTFSSIASHATALEKLNSLFEEYNKRFASGHYVSDSSLIKAFNIKQDAMVAELKQSKNLQQVLFIQNSYDTALTVTVYTFSDEQNNLIGIYYDLSKYYDEETRSYLRFSHLEMVATGLNFVPVNGNYALIIKGFYFKPEAGGTLQFNYLKDLNKNSWGATNVFLIKKNNAWLLTDEKSTPVTLAYVKAWTSFFPPNGGVKEFILR